MVRKVGKDEEAELYKHYTIQTLHAPRQNEKATELYQMLCITEPTIDGRCKQMDVMCFLDLFPFGVSGMHHPREVPLQLRDPRLRLNQQYLFLFHRATVSSGIYHKLQLFVE